MIHDAEEAETKKLWGPQAWLFRTVFAPFCKLAPMTEYEQPHEEAAVATMMILGVAYFVAIVFVWVWILNQWLLGTHWLLVLWVALHVELVREWLAWLFADRPKEDKR